MTDNDVGLVSLGGVISGATIVLGVLLGEWFVRLRERANRRDLLIAEVRIALPGFHEIARVGGILHMSPGSTEGKAAAIEGLRIFGLLHDLLGTVRWPYCGRRGRFRDECMFLTAIVFLGITEAPLDQSALDRLNAEGLAENSRRRPAGKGFDAFVNQARRDYHSDSERTS